METLISQSSEPMVFDAIPAVKVGYYKPEGLSIYTYARLYALENDIMLNLCSFERDPREDSAIEFYFGKKGTKQELIVTLTPNSLSCKMDTQEKGEQLVSLADPMRFAGVDEQGWYWGANMVIPGKYLKEIGIQVKAGHSFSGAVVKRWLATEEGEQAPGALGCSAQLSYTNEIKKENFDQFTLVKY